MSAGRDQTAECIACAGRGVITTTAAGSGTYQPCPLCAGRSQRMEQALTYISSPTMGRGEQDAADFALTCSEVTARETLRRVILMARAALAVTRSA